MQYSQEHLKTMVYAEFGGQTECIMGNSKIENSVRNLRFRSSYCAKVGAKAKNKTKQNKTEQNKKIIPLFCSRQLSRRTGAETLATLYLISQKSI